MNPVWVRLEKQIVAVYLRPPAADGFNEACFGEVVNQADVFAHAVAGYFPVNRAVMADAGFHGIAAARPVIEA